MLYQNTNLGFSELFLNTNISVSESSRPGPPHGAQPCRCSVPARPERISARGRRSVEVEAHLLPVLTFQMRLSNLHNAGSKGGVL